MSLVNRHDYAHSTLGVEAKVCLRQSSAIMVNLQLFKMLAKYDLCREAK